VRRFVECEVADRVSVFFVSVLDMKSRRMVCPECGEDWEVPAAPAAPAARPASATSAPPAEQKAGARERPSERELEKMLADLKKKMGQ
jgi:ribosomal protein L12E/L44/L45/RPP1/RPP2